MKLHAVALWTIALGWAVSLSSPPALAQAPADGAILEKDIPIEWVVNTHAHGDHYFGNAVFSSYYHFLTTGRPQNAYP